MNIKLIAAAATLVISGSTFAKTYTFSGQDLPPYNFEEKGAAAGRTVEFMKEVCKEIKQECKFLIVPTARSNKMIVDGELDGLMTLTKQPDRDVHSNFGGVNLTTARKVYMAKKGAVPVAKSHKEFGGKTVVSIRGSATGKDLLKHNEEVKTMVIKEEVDYQTIITRLKNDQYGPGALVIGTESTIRHYGDKEKVELETVLAFKDEAQGVYFSKKTVTPEELEMFNKAFAKLEANGTRKKILGE